MDGIDKRSLWRDELIGLGGSNPLTGFEQSSFGQIDLSRSHPGGLAQLTSARTTTMGNLVRDGVAQSRALSAARRIRAKAKRIEATFGMQSCFIAAGLIEVASDSRKLPILLWATHLIPKGDDYEVRIEKEPILNPAVGELIRQRRGDFRESDLLAVASGQGDLIPVAVLALVAELVQGSDIEVQKLLLLGNFVPDLLKLQKLGLGESSELVNELISDSEIIKKPAITELTLVANADDTQREVIRRALAGDSFAVDTLPGCGYLQTVVNILANLALEGKTALLIAPRPQTADELAERLTETGLAGVAIRNTDTWVDTVAAISRNEKAQPNSFEAAKLELAAAQAKVTSYFASIESNKTPVGVSLISALSELAKLSGLSPAPTNNARIKPELLIGIHQRSLEVLSRALEMGLFSYGARETPWFHARFSNQAEIDDVLASVTELAGEELRTLRYQINRYLQDLSLSASDTVEHWAEQLNLLLGIRETLDRFLPAIYDRNISDLIAATAARGERGALSGAQRRRFKKLAKEYIRPGGSVSNLHEALVQAELQRSAWGRFCQTQAPPTVPLGLSDVQSKFEKIIAVITQLQRHLDPNPDIELLTRLKFPELEERFNELAARTEILAGFIDRLPLIGELEALGLGALADELCRIHPGPEQLVQELNLAWWQSAFEAIVSGNPEILGFSAQEIAKLEAEFEAAGQELMTQGLLLVQDNLATRWKKGVEAKPAQADVLRQQLRNRDLSAKSGWRDAKELWEELTTAQIASPFRIHELSDKQVFDVVIVLDAASIGIAEAIPAIARASQIIAFGDPVLARPENFDTVARANQGYVPSLRQSAFDAVAKRYGKLEISRNYRTQGQVLGVYLNQNFYQNRLILEPAVGQFSGVHNFEHLEITEGGTALSTIEGATESLEAEVAQVANLVMNHARWTPHESLMVVTASKMHAERITALVEKLQTESPQDAEFFAAHGRESFEVVTMSELTHRMADRVIFSIGFGRTPEGRISGTLGDFNSEFAVVWMANQIVSARKRMSVVSCYNFEDFAAGKLPENQIWLKDLIAPSFLSEVKSGEPDPLLLDLSMRLRKLGIRVALNFGGRIGLAISYGNRSAVVDPDWALVGESWDEKLRLRPGLLKAMGWEYLRVHALELFAKPQDVANRIAMELGIDLVRKAQPLFDQAAFEDTNRAWGDPDDSNDDRLRDDKPPHWG